MSVMERVIKGLECCMGEGQCCGMCDNCPYNTDRMTCNLATLHQEALELLKAQEPVEPNEEQYQCNKCEFYQGVHNVRGHAPCSFWDIGGVMWNDYCSRFSQFTDKKNYVNQYVN